MKCLPSWFKKERERHGPHLPCYFLHMIRLPQTLGSGYVPPFQKRRAVGHDWQLGWCGIEAAELKGKACDSVAGLCSKYHLWPCGSLSEWGLRGDPGNGEITAPFWHGNTSRTPRRNRKMLLGRRASGLFGYPAATTTQPIHVWKWMDKVETNIFRSIRSLSILWCLVWLLPKAFPCYRMKNMSIFYVVLLVHLFHAIKTHKKYMAPQSRWPCAHLASGDRPCSLWLSAILINRL